MPTPEKVKERNRAYYARNREAMQERSKLYAAENKEARAAYRKAYYARTKEKAKENAERWAIENPERRAEISRRASLKFRCKKFGLTVEQYEQMLADQGGRCKICGAAETGTGVDWHIDHCHATQVVRGLLCHHCNAALGHVRDSVETLSAMIFYLGGTSRGK